MSCSHRLVVGEDPRAVAIPSGSRSAGFTLIELMIVIAIIAVLSTLVVRGVRIARLKAAEASATSTVSSISAAINSYNRDEGVYPAWNLIVDDTELEEFNAFPVLYESLNGQRPPEGKAGKNAPYIDNLRTEMIAIVDLEFDEEYIRPGREDLFDPQVDKYYLDPWLQPFRYRENDSKKRKEMWMIKRAGFDLWSIGPDGENSACFGLPEEGEEYDDIGNW